MKKIRLILLGFITSILFSPSVFALCDIPESQKDRAEASIIRSDTWAIEYCGVIEEAFNAVRPYDTIFVEKNITLTADRPNITAWTDANYTIVVGSMTIQSNYSDYVFRIMMGDVIIIGGNFIHNGSGAALFVSNASRVRIEQFGIYSSASGDAIVVGDPNDCYSAGILNVGISTTIIGSNNGITLNNHSPLLVDNSGGSISGGNAGISVNGTSVLEFRRGGVSGIKYGITGRANQCGIANPTIKITGGTIKGDVVGIYQPHTGSTTISGGTVEGSTGIVARQGSINISDGTIKGNGTTGNIEIGGVDTNLPSGAAIVVDNVTREGFEEDAKVIITGGTLNATYEETVVSMGDDAEDFSISGGTFNKPINDGFLAEGYEFGENGEVGKKSEEETDKAPDESEEPEENEEPDEPEENEETPNEPEESEENKETPKDEPATKPVETSDNIVMYFGLSLISLIALVVVISKSKILKN